MGWAERAKVRQGNPEKPKLTVTIPAPGARHVRFVDRSYSVDEKGTFTRVPVHVPTARLTIVKEAEPK